MALRQYGPLLWRTATLAGVLLAEVLVRGTVLGDGRDQLDYFRLPPLLYSFLLIWAGALLILTAVEGSQRLQQWPRASRAQGHPWACWPRTCCWSHQCYPGLLA